MWTMIQIKGSFKDGKRVAGAKFHKRFVEKLEEQIQQIRKDENDEGEDTIILNHYIPCEEANPENAKYLSGYIYISYDITNKDFVERALVNRIHHDVTDSNMELIIQRSRSKNSEEDTIKENDAVRIIEEGDFYGFDGRVSKIEGDFYEVIVTIFNQDCIVKLDKSKVQKVSNNIENYSLKIIR
jgi:transcription antitermination factor NusG